MANNKWAIDPTHSEIQFKVRHLLVSNVSGQFKSFTANVETEEDDITTAKIHVAVDVNSITTNNEQRDGHLKTGDFFDVENHPQLTFEGAGLIPVEHGQYKLNGTLTMRGVSKEVGLNVEFGGMVKDPWGNDRVGFSITGKVNRKDYGVSFSMVSETGGILLGEEVAFTAEAEFVKVKESPAA